LLAGALRTACVGVLQQKPSAACGSCKLQEVWYVRGQGTEQRVDSVVLTLLPAVHPAAKLGQSKESLRLLKAFNVVQALLTASVSCQQLCWAVQSCSCCICASSMLTVQAADQQERGLRYAAASGLRPFLLCTLSGPVSSPQLATACGFSNAWNQRTQVETCMRRRACLSVCVQVVLSAWQYHQGTQTGGVPTYHNSKVAAAFISSRYPTLPGE
jgi:hypothetical protein